MTKKKIISLCNHLVNELMKNKDELTREDVIEILGENAGYYSLIVDGLVHIGKINRIKGRNGGIKFRSVQGLKRMLTENNKSELKEYYNFPDSDSPSPTPIITENFEKNVNGSKYNKHEEKLYDALKDYLEEYGNYDKVEVYGNQRSGGVHENVDLIALSYQADLKYSLCLIPELVSYEVKANWPTVKDVQQAANYLKFSHRVYLCFYHEEYRGDYDLIYKEIKDQELWDLSQLYKIGLIVAFKKQERSSYYCFQIIKDAPYNNSIDVKSIDIHIDKYFSEGSKKKFQTIVKKQLKELL